MEEEQLARIASLRPLDVKAVSSDNPIHAKTGMRALHPAEWWIATEYFKDNPKAQKLSRKSSDWSKYLSLYHQKIALEPSKSDRLAKHLLNGSSKRERLKKLARDFSAKLRDLSANLTAFTKELQTDKARGLTEEPYSYWNDDETLVHSFERVRLSDGAQKLFMLVVHRSFSEAANGKIKLCFDESGKPWVRKVEKLTSARGRPNFKEAPVVAPSLIGEACASRVVHQRRDSEYVTIRILIMPLYDSGNMGDLVRMLALKVSSKGDRITALEAILSLFGQLLQQVESLHEGQVLHLDLKPANVFLHGLGRNCRFARVTDLGKLTAHVGDFGLSRFMGPKKHSLVSLCGTARYAAPEVELGPENIRRLATPASDVYGLGMILYDFAEAISSVELESLSLRMMENRPSQRPTIQQCLNQLQRIQDRIVHPECLLSFRSVVKLDLSSLLRIRQTLTKDSPFYDNRRDVGEEFKVSGMCP